VQQTARGPVWLLLLALAVVGLDGLELKAQEARSTVLWAHDFDGDGLPDVSHVEATWAELMGGGWPGRMVPIWFEGGLLVAGPGAALLDPPAALTTSDFVTLDPGPDGIWVAQLTLWKQFQATGGPAPPFWSEGPYVGVRFTAPDGPHLAWVNLGDAGDFGWQPTPGAPIRVGEKPAPPPPPEHESVRLVSIDLNGGGLDFVLRVRQWTNVVTGVTGTSAVLTNRAEFHVLVMPGEIAGEPVWFPWPLAEGVIPPTDPSPPASWRGAPTEVWLFAEQRDAQGKVLSRAGPLSSPGLIGTLPELQGRVRAIAFQGDGGRLNEPEDGLLLLWDVSPEVSGVIVYPRELALQGGGTVRVNPPFGVFSAGQVVELTALPDAAQVFVGWGGTLRARPIR
jgi:hypothetical protein